MKKTGHEIRSLVLLIFCCISLQTALPVQERLERNRSDLVIKLSGHREEEAFTPDTQSDLPSPTNAEVPQYVSKWPSFLRRSAALTKVAQPTSGPEVLASALRGRRHTHTGSHGGHRHPHHAQLMRVGCVLGTCQVQNLSHRLYQLIGQSGREDTSPINPRSPHSYG